MTHNPTREYLVVSWAKQLGFAALVLGAPFVLIFSVSPCHAADSFTDTQRHLASLSDEQKRQLAVDLEKFKSLDTQKQERLRKLNEELADDPATVELTETMRRFHDWFKQLPAGERGKFPLLNKDDERIAFIRRLQDDQRRNAWQQLAKKLPPADEEAIYTWIKSFSHTHKKSILAGLPEPFSKKIENMGDESKQLSALLYVLFMKRGGGIDSPRPKPDDFLKLQANLTADTKQLLAQQPDEFAKHNLLHSWVVNVIWKKTFPEMDDKKLEDFSQTLSPPRREAFERMSPPDRERELRQTYAMSSLLGFRPNGMNEPPDDPTNRFGPGGPRNGPDDRGEPRPPRFGDMFKRMLDGPPPNDRPPTDGRVPEDRPPPK